jgi:hypothetical protein
MSDDSLSRALAGKSAKLEYGGYQRSMSVRALPQWESNSELSEYPIRDSQVAAQLIDLVERCPEVATALEIICSYCFSSETGDESGFAIVEDEDHPYPETVAIARSLQSRVFPGLNLYRAVHQFLAWGDCFGNLNIDFKERTIRGLLLLPVWEMFRVEDDYGNLQAFEQRSGLRGRDTISLHPVTVIHWRYNRRHLYGRSLFRESLQDWKNLKMGADDLSTASREMGVNANIHMMPPGADENYKNRYRTDYESQLKRGIVSDFYLLQGAGVTKAGVRWNPDLTALLANFNTWRGRIGMRSRVPPWLLGIELNKAREIAGQPALSFAIFVGYVRQQLAEGVRQMVNTELALKGVPPEQWMYRLQFPKIVTNPYEEADVSEPGVSDLDFLIPVRNGSANG